ncbi:MAG: M48 family metallopeptidase [Desulfobacterales bacterium]|nr:M48 family metallopeptidase [Desulfobacterales bacterium]
MQALDTVLSLAPEGWRVDIVRKKIRHIYFRVNPGHKTVRISVPVRINRTALSKAVSAKTEWLLRQMNRPVKQGAPEMISDDTTWYKGQAYPLTFEERSKPPRVVFSDDDGFTVYTRPGAGSDKKKAVLDGWYREQLRHEVKKLLDVWAPAIGVAAKDVGIRRMKTRWGSCNIRAARIWVNLALIRLDPVFLEYVVVHELIHLLEPGHNKRFYGFMDRFLPDWRSRKTALNKYTLL